MSRTFERAVVMGTGMMGPGIAATLALVGVRTSVLSRALDSANAGVEEAVRLMRFLQANGLTGEADVIQAEQLLHASDSMVDAVRGVDLVIESLPEEMALKQALFRELDAMVKPDAVLASNTSGLSITAIASMCTKHPERVMTTHFWNPPHLMPLVEIVCGEKTDVAAARDVAALLERCGKSPVVVLKDRPGQLGNRMHQALVREAVNIVAEGIASAQDVDMAVRRGFGMRLPAYGILEHQDLVGLKLGSAVVDYVARDLYNEPRAPELYYEMMAAGQLGAASGQGFYNWTTKSATEVKARRDAFLVSLLLKERGLS